MYEKKFAEVFELGNGNVSGAGGLETFDARDTDTDVGSLDHGDVVCAVANGEEDGFQVAFHELDDEGLLEGRDTAFVTLAGG